MPAGASRSGRPPPPYRYLTAISGMLERLAGGFFTLELRDSLTEMDSRFRGNDGQTVTASVKLTCLAEMTAFQ